MKNEDLWFLLSLFLCILTALTAYVLSKKALPGVRIMNLIVIFTMLFNGGLVATYISYVTIFHIKNTVMALIVPSLLMNAFSVMLVRNYFSNSIPEEIYESARIDGASRAYVFRKIIMPMSKPIVIYTIMMAFMAPWGDYVFASYVALGRAESYNVAVGLYRWVNTNDYQGFFTRFCAGGVLVAIPITILFMFLQKYYVEGVTGGAVKG